MKCYAVIIKLFWIFVILNVCYFGCLLFWIFVIFECLPFVMFENLFLLYLNEPLHRKTNYLPM